ncbi:hypothetical protein [Clostridium sp. UBA6640]|uniref:hypothetical protein n=1 Tax=Clostridium sp. UBA6640 TaxID=1946370 RepID=UPI0025B8ADED|nr:hypothetical protein [Clostridium sp. UBA6640]
MRKAKIYLVIINIILLITIKTLNLDLFEIKHKISSLNIKNIIDLYRENSYLPSKSKVIPYKLNNLKINLLKLKRNDIPYRHKNIEFIIKEENHYIENCELLYNHLTFFQNNLNRYNITHLFSPLILLLDHRNKIRNLLKNKFNGSNYKEMYLI